MSENLDGEATAVGGFGDGGDDLQSMQAHLEAGKCA
jgi:hypothetical protein